MKATTLQALGAWLQARGLANTDAVAATALSGGQSNPTYRLQAGSQRYVLRMKPLGPLLNGAHAIDREYRVMSALWDSAVPVPRVHAYCDDPSIVGTPFYVMDFLQGRVLMDQALPGMTADERSAIYREMNRVIAALHAVDHQAAGLDDYGRPGNYFARQITRWSRQCRASTLPLNDTMRRLMDWLPEHVPAGEETTLVHGDYRMDNLMFHATEPRVIGILDWELSTLGHPLADFSYQCMGWHVPPALWRGIGGLDLAALGIPGEQEYVSWYVAATGREVSEHWDFYIAYNLFRMAAILHGIGQRAVDGNAAAPDAMELAAKAGPLAELAWNRVDRTQQRPRARVAGS